MININARRTLTVSQSTRVIENIRRHALIYIVFILSIYFIGDCAVTVSPDRPNLGKTFKIGGLIYSGSNDVGDVSEFMRNWTPVKLGIIAHAQAGADIVMLSETALETHSYEDLFTKNTYNMLKEETSQLAQTHAITIIVTTYDHISESEHGRNMALVFNTKGELIVEYQKRHPVFLAEPCPDTGTNELPHFVHEDTGSRIGVVICNDIFFPSYIAQSGRKELDLLLSPSHDWDAIGPINTEYASFRAIENSLTFVRLTRDGLTAAYDKYGERLFYFEDYHDHITGQVPVSVTMEVPSHGHGATMYPWLFNVFDYVLCVMSVCMILVLVFWNRALEYFPKLRLSSTSYWHLSEEEQDLPSLATITI